ncbi:acyl-CoA dehydrogenase [Actinoplanes lobatus]|uniref:Acyl-CoA dehydrogenase n=1 Tax=Actinoplanes lobatus TaxID=113568 RepID=A0A7W7HQV4_9ACTN|nr:acyl-CoA dehydrogenase family protein [Actinoplanes lobatus]MBB4754947.1 alkylation response protein AidB-like acyl-CoA dehydrogenase [Actinoplanes lobatus]GGN82939.1 acyl-CoA dehydrogenase [Actinoplanes lobatus]GIE40734.1 acyl-CoA dehydrogenase [Actinoplanes lobatus]
MIEERAALRAAVRDLAGGYAARDGFDAGLWGRLCKEIGVAGLAVPERYGGSGATLTESAVVLEELGRHLTPGPMLGCGVLATHLLLRSGDVRLLPGICAGDRIVAVAWEGSGTVADGLVSGSFSDVLDLAIADTLLVALPAGLYEVDPRSAEPLTVDPFDPTRPLSAIRLDRAPGRRLGKAAPIRDLAMVALAAEQTGTAERALELTVEYVRARHQFGRPIGSFQVLQHRLAEAYIRVQAARSAVNAALAGGGAEATIAKIHCSETLRAVAAEMVQMHGGLAITWEHDAHLYLRRAWASARLFGQPSEHVTGLAPSLLDS